MSGQGRKFGVDDLEEYIEQFGDTEPIFYLIERFLADLRDVEERELMDRLGRMIEEASTVISEYRAKK